MLPREPAPGRREALALTAVLHLLLPHLRQQRDVLQLAFDDVEAFLEYVWEEGLWEMLTIQGIVPYFAEDAFASATGIGFAAQKAFSGDASILSIRDVVVVVALALADAPLLRGSGAGEVIEMEGAGALVEEELAAGTEGAVYASPGLIPKI